MCGDGFPPTALPVLVLALLVFVPKDNALLVCAQPVVGGNNNGTGTGGSDDAFSPGLSPEGFFRGQMFPMIVVWIGTAGFMGLAAWLTIADRRGEDSGTTARDTAAATDSPTGSGATDRPGPFGRPPSLTIRHGTE